MNDAPASCVTLTDLIAMTWNGTSWPWIGRSTDSASRSTVITGSVPLGTGTSAMRSYALKSDVAPPFPPPASSSFAPTKRAYVSRFFLSAKVACLRRLASSSVGPPSSPLVLASKTTPPAAMVLALAFAVSFASSSSSSSSLIWYEISFKALVTPEVSTTGAAPFALTHAVSAMITANVRPLLPSLAFSFVKPASAIWML
mmetsp:Transcript_13407/g.50212  ORF Transcript_13407/g.50212 Transcript_13407/m.50212 type:complete len:200 (+) Transcript_13407:1409-2008(+)